MCIIIKYYKQLQTKKYTHNNKGELFNVFILFSKVFFLFFVFFLETHAHSLSQMTWSLRRYDCIEIHHKLLKHLAVSKTHYIVAMPKLYTLIINNNMLI